MRPCLSQAEPVQSATAIFRIVRKTFRLVRRVPSLALPPPLTNKNPPRTADVKLLGLYMHKIKQLKSTPFRRRRSIGVQDLHSSAPLLAPRVWMGCAVPSWMLPTSNLGRLSE